MSEFYKLCFITAVVCVFLTGNSLSQVKRRITSVAGMEFQFSTANPKLNDVFSQVGEEPEFPGGMDSLLAFAKRNISYPQSAINRNLEGQVILLFTINKYGMIVRKRFYKRGNDLFNDACLKLLKVMPLWKPGKLNAKPIDVDLHWSIIFRLVD
jgi:hypothetical protein